MRLLTPIESEYSDCMLVRAYDDESDVICVEAVERDFWPLMQRWAEESCMARLDAIVWAMRKFNIPQNWRTAYFRACGEWPE